ncbi:MAG: site-specific integrase [Candidatus Omnitrophica bacterium]|nr:site-specific integrase [Candidatus Omnitrophota bacterium]
MGTTFRRGKRWGINYIDDAGQQVRKIVSPYKETAEIILKKIEIEIAEGKYLDIKKEKSVLFEDFVQNYLNTYVRLENKNIKKQECLINNLVNHFKGKHLHQMDTLTIRQYLSQRLKKVKPSTVNRDFSMLKCMFNRAIEWGMFIGTNPTQGIKKIPEKNNRCRWLTEEEQNNLLSCCQGLTKVIVTIALKTGMRRDEIFHLKWCQSPNSNYVDFESGMIFIHESLAKSDKSRHIPLSNAVRLALQEVPRVHGVDYIFLNPETNKPLGSIKQSFKTAMIKAKIQDFRFHDLRHTFASSLVKNGVDLYVVQKLLGHATPKMTQRYAHLKVDQLKEAIKKIDIHQNSLLYNATSENSTDLAHQALHQNDLLPVVV